MRDYPPNYTYADPRPIGWGCNKAYTVWMFGHGWKYARAYRHVITLEWKRLGWWATIAGVMDNEFTGYVVFEEPPWRWAHFIWEESRLRGRV